MFSVDVRSRLDSEVDQIDLDAWIDDQLPLLLDKNSLIASEGAQILGCRPLGIRVSKKAFGAGRRFPIINHFREDVE